MAGDGDPAGLRWMFELPMTAALCDLVPAVVVNKAQNISRLHSSFFSIKCIAALQGGEDDGDDKHTE